MAKQMSSYSAPKTDFAGFYQPDAAGTATFSTKGDPQLMAEDMAQFEAQLASAKEQLNQQIDKKVDDADTRDTLKAAAADWFDAAAATIKAGKMDGGGSLKLSPDSMTFIAGAHIADTAKIESGLKKLEEAAKKSPDFPGIKWNAAEHAGVNVPHDYGPSSRQRGRPAQDAGRQARRGSRYCAGRRLCGGGQGQHRRGEQGDRRLGEGKGQVGAAVRVCRFTRRRLWKWLPRRRKTALRKR